MTAAAAGPIIAATNALEAANPITKFLIASSFEQLG
jgi:hypothetical protein